jgi:serine/threonine protein phosphatase PrpC
LTRFDLATKDWSSSSPTAWAAHSPATLRVAWPSIQCANADRRGRGSCDPDLDLVECLEERDALRQHRDSSQSQEDSRCAGMGATFTGAAIRGDSLDLVQVGDSRGYVIRKDQIRLATKDQSLVQQLVDVGQISESEAETHMFRNVILQALGAQSEVNPVTGKIRLRQDDVVLLCSDGLSGKLRAEDIQHIVVNSKGISRKRVML